MQSKQFLHVVGARPNFMKAAPVLRALSRYGVRQSLVHTGQHYDARMSDAFFRELELPEPDINLGVGSGSHTEQTAQVMVGLERVLHEHRPDIVVVYGDVNSTVAAALVSAQVGVPVAHVEAGLRSRDRSMPEEINRMITDRIADWLLTPSADADENLRAEGVDPARIHCVGNVMIDTLTRLLPRADGAARLTSLGLGDGEPFVLVTLHRPSNVDDSTHLRQLVSVLEEVSSGLPVIFPVHPRTRQRLGTQAVTAPRLHLTPPLGYLEFLGLQRHATLVVTDSGGIQEETTFLGVPCLTVRDNTERPITVTHGTNRLIGRSPQRLQLAIQQVLDSDRSGGTAPPLWDGHASDRIAAVLST
ncbi:MAG: UDP-N-acetylglucosamine 2-epimerase (non-hydrolyzing) [Luteitalea sp.]|nr:UDP-N-acetylglucosamine 2-epimerase (non-hydrolyzing) [Luteitalea sp.]